MSKSNSEGDSMCKTRKARLAYTGAALDDGYIDVHALAPALIAFGELASNSYKAIGGEGKINTMLSVDSFQSGSFDIVFTVTEKFLTQVRSLVSMSKQNGIDDLMTVLGWSLDAKAVAVGAITSIWGLCKWIGGRKIKSAKATRDGVLVVAEDGATVSVTNNVWNVYTDRASRKSLEQTLAPLSQEGVTGFEIRNACDRSDKSALFSTDSSKLKDYASPEEPSNTQTETTAETEKLVSIVSVNFDNGKWRMNDGGSTFWATIEDKSFIQKVDAGEYAFAKGDMLKIRYYQKQTITDSRLVTAETIVTKVLELKRSPKQIAFDFNGDTQD